MNNYTNDNNDALDDPGIDEIRQVRPRDLASVWSLCTPSAGDDTTQRNAVSCQPFTIGRHSRNTMTVANSTVSGKHAELLLAGDKLLVRDCGSTNGTLLNGRRIHSLEPLERGDILHFGSVMFTVHRGALPGRMTTVSSDTAGEALAQVQFGTLLARPGIDPNYQPIVNMDDRTVIGYEVLSRSRFVGLETPAKMFRVAAQRMSEAELSRVCRMEGLRGATTLDQSLMYFLNTHPVELCQPELLASLHALRNRYPEQEIVLEVHESGVTSLSFLRDLREVLQDLKIKLAYDDFGSGQARLMELIEVPPDILKFDVKLVQGLPTASQSRRTTISSLIRIVKDLDVVPLAEGVETEEEAAICRELGFELAQGFLFGRGEPASHWITDVH